jgi:hypothetical protein
MRSSRNIVAWEGWRKRRQRAEKGRAIGIEGVSSAGDNLRALIVLRNERRRSAVSE